MTLKKLTRREFLRRTGLCVGGLALGLGSNACTTIPKNVNWNEVPDSEFSISKFNDWFETYKLSNGLNPNLNFSQRGDPKYSTYKASVRNGVSPGIDYTSGKLYAVADGKVLYHEKINPLPNRLGGDSLGIAHPGEDDVFISVIAHIGTIHVKAGAIVKRGQVLADVAYTDHAKLMLKRGANWIDPDNHGINHGYMTCWDGTSNLEVSDMQNKEEKQRGLIRELANQSPSLDFMALSQRQHRPKKQGKLCMWDEVEIFRYLTELYDTRPQLFPNLAMEKFIDLKNEFYTNQPIILTLPLKE
jgi:hypothetical protein